MGIDGVVLEKSEQYVICHVEHISEQLKQLIRQNLTIICHGSIAHEMPDEVLFGYESTVKGFLERYETKTPDTKKGMIGELLAHILLPRLLDDYTVASAFFNLEEKSIKKGFDLIFYKSQEESFWITEVKSGNLHKDCDHDETIAELLDTARGDLSGRLSEQEKMYWQNAINHVRLFLSDEKDYKKALVRLLVDEGNAAANKMATSKDNSVILVANLFEPFGTRITCEPAKKFLKKIEGKYFSNVLVFCAQKETYSRIVDFLTSDANKGGA